MKPFLIILFVICLNISGFSQKMGLKGGLVLSNFIPSQMNGTVSPLMGITTNIIIDFPYTKNSSFQTEMGFCMLGSKYTDSIPKTPNGFFVVTERNNYLTFPISYKFRVGGKRWKIFTVLGAEPAFLINNNRKLYAEMSGVPIAGQIYHPYEINRLHLGLWAGMGFLYRNIFIDASYHIGLTNVYTGDSPLSARNTYISATLGSFFKW